MIKEEFEVQRNCFVCNKVLTGGMNDEETHKFGEPPMDAVVFQAQGNYGSAIFDPIGGGNVLEISICDCCLDERRDLTIEVFPIHKTVYQLVRPENSAFLKLKRD